VNDVAPGGIRTDLRGVAALGQAERSHFTGPGWERLRTSNPLQLALRPDDLAGAYVFLACTANAKGIMGVIMTVDAGSTLRMPRLS
jgi:NAD(P)-dependent dehydrogenase (short-subunit alcohol dehydrogenase family)